MELENKIEEYEKLCPRCGGTGRNKIFVTNNLNDIPSLFEGIAIGIFLPDHIRKNGVSCPKCNGKGKLDWIDKIKGIK